MNITTSVSSITSSETDCLTFLLDHAFENQFSVAVWRLPDDTQTHLLIARKHQLLKREAYIEGLAPGFMFAPFDRQKDSIFLPADYVFSFASNTLSAPEDPLEIASHTWLQEQAKRPKPSVKPQAYALPAQSGDRNHDDYLDLVHTSLREIENGHFEKVVASRTKTVDLPPGFDIVHAFQKLSASYPNALVSFVSSPETGSWLGASPEVLVRVEDKTIFRTVALAGTQPYREGTPLKSVAWTQKEIEEQALVERYIISCFKKIRLREYDEHGPKTVVAGNLMHLKSDFTVDMKATNFPQLGSVMLQLLHPTSAVCGMPLEPSLEFLKKQEHYDREFYSGFLGPINFNNNIDIFVNLRCMQLQNEKATLYAGAGITIDSIPEHEWEETEMKLNTLLSVIRH